IGSMLVLVACGSDAPPGASSTDDSAPPVVDSEPDTVPEDSDTPPPPPVPTTVRIAELVSDPVNAGMDWLELWNDGEAPIDLAGWSIQDRGGSTVSLSGELRDGERRVLLSSELGFTLDKDGGSLTLRVGNAVVQSFA